MHRHELAVLAVVGALVLWGGAATAVHAPTGQTTADAADGAAAAAVVQPENASVSFADQTANDSTVTIESVTVPEGGYVTIHDSSLLDGNSTESVVGVSEYLDVGTHEDVEVTLYEDVEGADFEDAEQNDTQTLVAMPHMETTDDTAYDFVASDGEDDGPYVTDGEPVTDDAEVTFDSDGAVDGEADGETDTETDDEADNETDTGTDGEVDDETDTDDDDQTDGEADNETDVDADRGVVVSDLEAPAYAATNSTVAVNATVENTGEDDGTEDVAFRLEGGGVDLVVHENVSVDAGETENVSFDVNTTDVPEDEYIHGVTTYNSSEFSTITVTGDAQVDIGDQESDGTNVTVDDVFLPEGGYVVIHDSSLPDGDATETNATETNVTETNATDDNATETNATDDNATDDNATETNAVDSVIGVSEYLDAGYYEDVEVTLYEDVEGADFDTEALEDDETVIAMPHMETTDDTTFDFVASDGEDDGPYVTDGEPVTDDAQVNVTDGEADEGDDDGIGTEDGDENETTTTEDGPTTDDDTTTTDDTTTDDGGIGTTTTDDGGVGDDTETNTTTTEAGV